MSSKREAKRDDEEEEESDEMSESGSESEESGSSDSDEEMSESEDDSNDKKKHAQSKPTPKANGVAGPGGEKAVKTSSERSLQNQPFDEAVDLSESEDHASIAADSPKKVAKPLKNMPFDEALELSASAQDLESPVKRPAQRNGADGGKKGKTAGAGTAGGKAAPSSSAPPEVKNRPFDEVEDLSDSGESIDTNGPSSPKRMAGKKGESSSIPQISKGKDSPTKKDDKPMPKPDESRKAPPAQLQHQHSLKPTTVAAITHSEKKVEKAAPSPKKSTKAKVESESSESGSGSGSEDDDDEDEDDDEEEEEENGKKRKPGAKGGSNASGGGASTSAAHTAMMASAGGYKESDYAHLKVSNEIKELFQYIGRFKPQEIELETRLKCFIPEYIPAVGDMDAFLKIPRPDDEPDALGLKMLDEPALLQSDATVLDLQLRATSKKKHGDIVVRSIENAEKAPKEIDRWIKSIADLHRTKPPPQVHYTKPMPDIESLMQVWPEEFEELLGKPGFMLPNATLDVSIEQYIRILCAILDIPVYKNVYESLHVLFTLYLEFRSNQHFMNYEQGIVPSSSSPSPYLQEMEENSRK